MAPAGNMHLLHFRLQVLQTVLAPSFARIFYRNAVDGGYLLPIEIERSAVEKISDKNTLEIDVDKNAILDVTTSESFAMKPFPSLIKKIIECGGILHYRS